MTQLDVTAQQTPVDYKIAANGALGLAQALQETTPLLTSTINSVAGKLQSDGETQAKKDALSANGAKYADAVKSGTIQPTANPFYMQAYERESSAISASKDLSALQLQSDTWPEKNDAAAFQNRWSQEVSNIGKNYSTPDENAGFLAASGQVTQQTIATNQATVAKQITEQRTQNVSALASDALVQAQKASGGSLTGAVANKYLEASHYRWTSTGGNEADWNKIVIGAVQAAGYSTGNSGMIDLLKDPALIGQPSATNAPASLSDGSAPGTSAPSVQAPGAAASQPQSPAPSTFNSANARAAVTQLFGETPGPLSGQRTPEQNAKVTGVPDSMHLTGQAIDFPLPPGMTPEEVKAKWIASGHPITEFLYEGAGHANSTGPHIHIGWAPTKPSMVPPSAQAYSTDNGIQVMPPAAPATSPGGPSLYDQAGVAEAAETARYRIDSNAQDAITGKYKILTTLQNEEGQKGLNMLYQTHGLDILTGNYDVPSLLKELTASGISPPGAVAALNLLHAAVSDSQGLMEAKHKMAGDDPTQAKATLDLALYGRKNGWSQDYENAVGKKVLDGTLSSEDGIKFVGASVDRSKEDLKDTSGSGKGVKNYSDLRNHAESLAQTVAYQTLKSAGYPVSDDEFRTTKERIANAGGSYLEGHPGDFAGSYQAMARETAMALTEFRHSNRRTPASTIQTQPGQPQQQQAAPQGNPRR